ETEFESVQEAIESLHGFRDRLGESPAVLADWLELMDKFDFRLGKLLVYAMMCHTVDTTDQPAAARHSRASALRALFRAASAFGEPELLMLGRSRLDDWTRVEPRLEVYKHHFDRIFSMESHIRSAEVEELLGMSEEPFQTAR